VEESRGAPPADAWRESFAQSIGNERRRAGQRVADHRQRLSDLDARIAEQIEAAIAALSREQDQNHQVHVQSQAKSAALDERQKLLDQRQKQLDARQTELDKLQADTTGAKLAEGERLKDLKRREAELAAEKDALEIQLTGLNAERDALIERESSLRLKEQALDAREQQTKRQRQTVARQLRARKQEMLAEAAREQAAQQAHELEAIRRESKEQIQQLRADFAAARENETQLLRRQLEDVKKQLSAAEAERDRTLENCDEQRRALRLSDSSRESAGSELTELRAENRKLQQQLADAQENASAAPPDNSQEVDDLKRRFEMAVQDVRELKTKNVELAEQLAQAQSSPGHAPIVTAGGGWESLKQKLMADLDGSFDDAKPADQTDKVTVENTIKITDEVVAAKDREIEELQRLLDSQAKQVGDMAVGAAAVAQMLDTDELVQQEREALKRLQDQLREQLRQAELDISLERAKLAREKSEMEEKMRCLETEKANLSSIYNDSPSDNGKKPKGRKWLTRLGLGDSDDTQNKS
jgi:chromosome segregation ATPase